MADHLDEQRRRVAAQICRIADQLASVLSGCADMREDLMAMAKRCEDGSQTEHDLEAIVRLHAMVLGLRDSLRLRRLAHA